MEASRGRKNADAWKSDVEPVVRGSRTSDATVVGRTEVEARQERTVWKIPAYYQNESRPIWKEAKSMVNHGRGK